MGIADNIPKAIIIVLGGENFFFIHLMYVCVTEIKKAKK